MCWIVGHCGGLEREGGYNYMVLSGIKEDADGAWVGTILMTDARYDKHLIAAPPDIIADLCSRRPEKVGARVQGLGSCKASRKCPASSFSW